MGLFRSPDGKTVVEVPDSDASHALDLGYTPETPAGASEGLTERDRGGGGVGGAIGAGISSTLSGATLGASDWLAKGLLTADQMQALADERAQHPYVSTGGQIVGMVAPALLSDGASLSGQIAGATPAGILSRYAGEGLEASRALGGVKGALATVGVSGLEGAAQNAGMYLSDVALGDRDLTAEGLGGALGSGFAFGGVAGGTTYALESGTMAARRMFAKLGDDARDATTKWDRVSSDVLDAHDQTAAAAQQRLREIQAERQALQASKARAGADIAQAKLDMLPSSAASTDEAFAAGANAGKQAADTEIAAHAPVTSQVPDAAITDSTVSRAAEPQTALEQQLAQMKSQIDAGATLQDLKIRPPQSEEALNQEESAIRSALDDYGSRRAKVNEWINRIKNPRTEFIHPDVPEGVGESPLVRGRITRPLDEDVMIEQSGGQIRTIGKGEHTLEDITQNSRILARSNADSFSRGSVLDDAYNDAIDRAQAAETRPEMEAALHEAADIEKQIHAYVREAKPENGPVIDRIEKVRAENGRTGYHAALARAESRSMREAEAAGVISPQEARDFAKGAAKAKAARSAVEDVHEAQQVLGDYEKSAAKLTETLGDRAPATAQQHAADMKAAEDTATRKQVERTTRAVDDQMTPQKRIESARRSRLEAEAKLQKLKAEEIEMKGKLKEAPKKGQAKIVRKPSTVDRIVSGAQQIGSGLELASMAGIPGIPHPSQIPVIGPLLGAYIRFRALAGRLFGRIPATGEARAAALASKTRTAMSQHLDRALGVVERAAPAAKQLSISTTEALGRSLLGAKSSGTDDPRELCAERVQEIASATPDAIVAHVREEMSGVTDPDLITAAEQFRLRQFAYLQSIAPPLAQGDPFSGKKPPPPSRAAAQTFGQALAVVNDPSVALQAVKNGTLTPVMADAAWAMYPKLMQEGQTRLVQHAGSVKAPYHTILRLQMLYRYPLDPLSDPATIHLLQPASASKGLATPTQNQPPTPSVAGPVDLGKLYQNPADRRAARS